jgi:hypothetical protein
MHFRGSRQYSHKKEKPPQETVPYLALLAGLEQELAVGGSHLES